MEGFNFGKEYRFMYMYILVPALKVLGFLFLAAGFGAVFSAKKLAVRLGMDKKVKCEFENEMSEEELQQYRMDRATVNMKMIGMLISIPGLVLILTLFK